MRMYITLTSRYYVLLSSTPFSVGVYHTNHQNACETVKSKQVDNQIEIELKNWQEMFFLVNYGTPFQSEDDYENRYVIKDQKNRDVEVYTFLHFTTLESFTRKHDLIISNFGKGSYLYSEKIIF